MSFFYTENICISFILVFQCIVILQSRNFTVTIVILAVYLDELWPLTCYSWFTDNIHTEHPNLHFSYEVAHTMVLLLLVVVHQPLGHTLVSVVVVLVILVLLSVLFYSLTSLFLFYRYFLGIFLSYRLNQWCSISFLQL